MSNLYKMMITVLGLGCWLFNAPPTLCIVLLICLSWLIVSTMGELINILRYKNQWKDTCHEE